MRRLAAVAVLALAMAPSAFAQTFGPKDPRRVEADVTASFSLNSPLYGDAEQRHCMRDNAEPDEIKIIVDHKITGDTKIEKKAMDTFFAIARKCRATFGWDEPWQIRAQQIAIHDFIVAEMTTRIGKFTPNPDGVRVRWEELKPDYRIAFLSPDWNTKKDMLREIEALLIAKNKFDTTEKVQLALYYMEALSNGYEAQVAWFAARKADLAKATAAFAARDPLRANDYFKWEAAEKKRTIYTGDKERHCVVDWMDDDDKDEVGKFIGKPKSKDKEDADLLIRSAALDCSADYDWGQPEEDLAEIIGRQDVINEQMFARLSAVVKEPVVVVEIWTRETAETRVALLDGTLPEHPDAISRIEAALAAKGITGRQNVQNALYLMESLSIGYDADLRWWEMKKRQDGGN